MTPSPTDKGCEPCGNDRAHLVDCSCPCHSPSANETAHICDPETYTVVAGRGWCAQCPEILAANETGKCDKFAFGGALKDGLPICDYCDETADKHPKPATPDPKELSCPTIRECLEEAVDLMEDVLAGNYKPDSFTTQPWRSALSKER